MGEHATREDEIDDLLRGEVLVDLYRVTRQALRASLPRYSIKNVEELYGFERHAEVAGGSESLNAFEAGTRSGTTPCSTAIARLQPRGLPLALRAPPLAARAAARRISVAPSAGPARADRRGRGAATPSGRVSATGFSPARRRATRAGSSRTSSTTTGARRSRSGGSTSTTASLDEEELLEDANTLGGLEPDGEPVPDKQSLEYTFMFPPQEHKIGGRAVDPKTEREYDVRVDNEHGTLTLRRGRRWPTSRSRRP